MDDRFCRLQLSSRGSLILTVISMIDITLEVWSQSSRGEEEKTGVLAHDQLESA